MASTDMLAIVRTRAGDAVLKLEDRHSDFKKRDPERNLVATLIGFHPSGDTTALGFESDLSKRPDHSVIVQLKQKFGTQLDTLFAIVESMPEVYTKLLSNLNTYGIEFSEKGDTMLVVAVHLLVEFKHLPEMNEKLSSYINTAMNEIAPNLTALMGEEIGSQLIASAGGLMQLAESAGSGLQKLRFGAAGKIICNAPVVCGTGLERENSIGRKLGNQAAKAIRVDAYATGGDHTNAVGKKCRKAVEVHIKELLKKGPPAKKQAPAKKHNRKTTAKLATQDVEDDDADLDLSFLSALVSDVCLHGSILEEEG